MIGILKGNTWNHLALQIICMKNWSHTYLLRIIIIISYLKPYNCL